MLEAIIAITMRYRPAQRLNVVEVTPELAQGETTENPTAVPNARSNKDSAAEATPPARTAAQEIAETSDSAVPSLSSDVRTSAMRVSRFPFSSSDISPDFGSKSNKSK
jgi:hypothetical protein